MHILFPIGTLYPSQQGGPSNTIYWLAKGLVAKSISVTCVSTSLGAEHAVETGKWMDTDYGRVIYLKARFHQLPLRMIACAARQINACDCVHLNSLFYPPSFLLAILAILKKKPVIWSCRGNLDPEALRYSKWKKGPVLWLIRNFLSGGRTTFHATSETEKKHIHSHFGGNTRVAVIPNYMELPEAVERKQAEPPYLLYVGRLHPVKALDRLIGALARSRAFIDSGFVLKIAGDDRHGYRKALEELAGQLGISEKVHFLGHVEGAEKQQLYADAYFSILPSHTENFGNVVIESLAQGTPVIASRGTPWEVLENKKAGIWSQNDPLSLSNSIERTFCLSEAEYQQYRRRSHSIVQKCFNIHKNISVWQDTFQFILRNPGFNDS
ncbi:MAG: glycosyltransferase [Lewinellaceae bacterium]|nr:glycosyltransferase [Lewinellaceae bacterium]